MLFPTISDFSAKVVFALLTLFVYHIFKSLASFLLDLAFQLLEPILAFLILFVPESPFLSAHVNNIFGKT